MEEKTYSLGLDQLVLGSLVLLLEADVFFVQRQHTLLDILRHVLARQRRTKVARILDQDRVEGDLQVGLTRWHARVEASCRADRCLRFAG